MLASQEEQRNRRAAVVLPVYLRFGLVLFHCSSLSIKRNLQDGAREIRTEIWTGERIVVEVAA
jgi:hypothetical protein